MADKIQIRAGNKAGMPALTDRELAYVRDENALYIGTPDGNKNLSGETKQAIVELQATITAQGAAIAEQQAAINSKLTAAPVAAQAELAADADLAAVVAAVNALIAAMKSSGVMNT